MCIIKPTSRWDLCFQAYTNFLMLYLSRELHVPLTIASFYMSIIFTLNLVGKVLFGFLLDRPDSFRYSLVVLALFVIGCALVPQTSVPTPSNVTIDTLAKSLATRAATPSATHVPHQPLVAFALVYGLGYGGVYTIVQSEVVMLFGGTESFAKLQAFLALLPCADGA